MRADPKFDEFVASLYLSTRSIRKVSRKLSIGMSTVSRALHRAGVQPPGRFSVEVHERKKRFHGALAKAVAAEYAAGRSMLALKRKYKCGVWAIRTAARESGISLRPQSGPQRRFGLEDSQEMVALYANGWSQVAIATKFKTSALMVSRILKLAGVKTRHRGAAYSEHPGWKGGRVVLNAGYVGVMIPHDDPLRIMANVTGYVPEHRLMVARALGRPLGKHETVHHINGDRKDNRLSNLQLRIGNHGAGVVAVCGKCGSREVIYEPIKATKPIISKQDS